MVVAVAAGVGPVVGRVVGVSVKRTLQQKHEKEPERRPPGRRLDPAVEGMHGMGQEMQHADSEEHAARERQQHLHGAILLGRPVGRHAYIRLNVAARQLT